MAVAFDAATNGGTTTGTSLTFSHTNGSGAERMLLVGFKADTALDLITGVTYNGVAMTLVDKQEPAGDRWTYLYYLVAPATGANNVVISASASTFIGAAAASYTGVAQVAPEASGKMRSTGATNGASLSVTTITDNAWLAATIANGTGAFTADGNTTSRVNSASGYGMADRGPVTPAGSTTVGTTAPVAFWQIVGAVLAPPAAAAGGGPILGGRAFGRGRILGGSAFA